MKITQSELARVTSAIAGVVSNKAPVAVLKMALLEAENGKLTILGTDLRAWLSLTVECDGDLPACLVPADKLSEAVAKLATGDLELTLADGALHIKAKGAKRKLNTVPLDSYPAMPAIEGDVVTFDGARLADALAFTMSHMSKEAARSYLCGVNLQSTDVGLRLTATDGKGAAYFDYGESAWQGRKTIADEFLKHFVRVMPDGALSVTADEKRVCAAWDGGHIVGNLCDGDFPDVERIIPSDGGVAIDAVASDMLIASGGVQALGTGDIFGKAVTMTVAPDEVTLTAQSHEGEATNAIEATSEGNVIIGFSSLLFDRALKGFGKAGVQLRMRDGISPVLITSDELADRFAVVMPKRI